MTLPGETVCASNGKPVRGSMDIYRLIFDEMQSMIAHMDTDFNFVRVNGAFAKAHGEQPEFFVGTNYFDIHTSRKDASNFNAVVATGKPYRVYGEPYDCRKQANGSVIYCDWTLERILSEHDVIAGVILTLVDVTERISSRKSLLSNSGLKNTVAANRSESELVQTRLTKAIDQATEGIAMTDENTVITEVNPTFERISGYSRSEIIGKSLRILESGKHGEDFHKEKWGQLERGESWRGRVVNKKKGGELYEVDSLITAIRDPDTPNRVLEYMAVERDVTSEVRLAEQLRQAHKMEGIGVLAGGIAHEMNNILLPVIMNLEMISEDLEEENPLRSSAELALTAAYRGRNLVNRIVTFSRKTDDENEVFSIGDVVRESIELIKTALPSTIQIETHIEANLGKITGSPTQLQEIILNLCNNAVQAMTSGKGIIEVTLANAVIGGQHRLIASGHLSKVGSYVELSVKDSGDGIEKTTQEKIFEPFFTTKDKGYGTGMGLSVVHGIVQGHGGAVLVESEPRKGALFQIYLPATELPSPSRPSSQKIPHGHGERVLLVDDKKDIVETGIKALERLGYRVDAETSSLRALERFATNPEIFDIAVLDYMMPEITGLDLAEKMRAIRPDIPIVLCTGFSGTIDPNRVKEIGVQSVVYKPITTNEMARLIKTTLDGHIL